MISASALIFAVVLTLLYAAYHRRHAEPDIEPDEYEEVEEWEEDVGGKRPFEVTAQRRPIPTTPIPGATDAHSEGAPPVVS